MLKRYETRIQVQDVFIDMKKATGRNKSIVHVKVQITGNLTLGRKEGFHFPDSEVFSRGSGATSFNDTNW